MYVHFGQKPYGKCDVVPELFYVATWFFEVDFIPLVPLGTRLILGKRGKEYIAVKIPFSWKSLVYTWVRAASLGGMTILGIMAVADFADRNQFEEGMTQAVMAVFFGIVFAFVMIYPRRKMPSYERACALAKYAGMNEAKWAALNVLYGRDPFERPQETDVMAVR